ncbi:MAG TPA: hypothetical protein PL182_01870 [Pseudobdellovibrionaceae bacterium]|nr:hypothetical protein [Pseudobdellovibrionaceae bacterium]
MIQKTAVALLATCFALPWAQAQIPLPQDRGYVGILAGYTQTSGLSGRFGFGAEGGLQLTNHMKGLLYFQSSTGDKDDIETQVLHYGVGADYAFMESAPGLSAGLRLGMGTAQPSGAGAGGDQSAFSIGPAVSYDWMIHENISIGGQAQYLWTMWDDTETSSYFFLTGKFWL